MKRQKPHNRIPWWCFDIPFEKPPTKGWWKIWQRRKERRYGKEQAKVREALFNCGFPTREDREIYGL